MHKVNYYVDDSPPTFEGEIRRMVTVRKRKYFLFWEEEAKGPWYLEQATLVDGQLEWVVVSNCKTDIENIRNIYRG